MENQKEMENLKVITHNLKDKTYYFHITRSQLISLWKIANRKSIETYGKKVLHSGMIVMLKEPTEQKYKRQLHITNVL